MRDRCELLAEITPEARWWRRQCRRHWLHGDGNHFINGRRRCFDNWGRRGFDRLWRNIAWASTVHASARRRGLALQTRCERRSLAAATNWAPAASSTSILSEIANSRSKDAATSTSIYGAAANTRPKALEDAAVLSMVTDGAMAHSSDAAKCEEQLTNNMRR